MPLIIKKQSRLKTQGFTLVETLVAISILTLSIGTAIGIAASGISSGYIARDQTTAFYLAQEAIEKIKNIRDNNALAPRPWLTGITDSGKCQFGWNCKVDSINNLLSLCGLSASSPCPFLNKDTNSHIPGGYAYALGSPPTQFRRTVRITSINSHEVSISVTVLWTKGSSQYYFIARDNMFDWHP